MVVKGDGSGTEVVLLAARPVCCPSCLLPVLFAARLVCCPSCLLQSKGFVPRAPGLWLNRNVSVTSPKFPCDLSLTPDLPFRDWPDPVGQLP
jgi:hypothetical protein